MEIERDADCLTLPASSHYTAVFVCSAVSRWMMLLSRDYVTYMSKEVVKKLVASQMIEASAPDNLTQRVKQAMTEELTVEDRLNEEVRNILNEHSQMMQDFRASYQEAFKKLKLQLAQKRKLVLR